MHCCSSTKDHQGLQQEQKSQKIPNRILGIKENIPKHQGGKDPSACKLAPKWEIPYLIDAEARKGAYWLATLEADIFRRTWNDIHLKAYYM